MKKRKIILIISLLLIQISSYGFLKIDLKPSFSYIDVRENKTTEVEVINTTNRLIRYKIELEKPEKLKNEFYMGDDIIVFPKVISLRPGVPQKIRFRLKNPIKNANGKEYAAKLVFSELKPDLIQQSGSLGDDVNVDIGFEVTVESYIYGSSGPKGVNINIENKKIQNITNNEKEFKILEFSLKNNSDSFFRGRGKVLSKNGEVLAEERYTTIFQDEEREIKVDITDIDIREGTKLVIYDRENSEKKVYEKYLN